MNILEALKLVDEGKIVRIEISDDIYYFLNAEILPFKKKKLLVISLGTQKRRGKFPPESFSALEYHTNYSIEIECIRSNNFTEVTYDDVISEIRKGG